MTKLNDQQRTAVPEDTNNEVLVSVEGAIARVSLNRPASLNGLTPGLCSELARVFVSLAHRKDVRVAILTGEGRAFCSGLDLKAAAQLLGQGGGGPEERERSLREDFHGLIRALDSFPQPLIARIPGAAVGFGFDMALCCDVRFGVADAKIGPAFTKIGLVPDGGGSWNLQRLVGAGRAMELILSGRTFSGQRAFEYGLFNEVFTGDNPAEAMLALDAHTMAFAEHLAALPPLALREAKALIKGAAISNLEAALENEAKAQLRLLGTADTAVAMSSFFTKKAPVYRGC